MGFFSFDDEHPNPYRAETKSMWAAVFAVAYGLAFNYHAADHFDRLRRGTCTLFDIPADVGQSLWALYDADEPDQFGQAVAELRAELCGRHADGPYSVLGKTGAMREDVFFDWLANLLASAYIVEDKGDSLSGLGLTGEVREGLLRAAHDRSAWGRS